MHHPVRIFIFYFHVDKIIDNCIQLIIIVLYLAQSVYRTDMPPPYPGIIGFNENPGYASAPPLQTAPPPQHFNGQGIIKF